MNDLPKLKKLLPMVNINAQDAEGRTAMHQAVIHSSNACSNFLMSLNGIDLRILDNQGKMAADYLNLLFASVFKELNLPKAVENNLVNYQLFKPRIEPDPVSLLIKAYNLPDRSRTSLARGLKQAAVENNHGELKEFIALMDDINVLDAKQRTALHWAALSGKSDCVAILKNHAAREDLKDCHNKTARDYFLEWPR